MKTKYTIIGGGVAGLSAAIRLAELDEEPLIIEGGSYPAHKVCGEFLSPECIDQLGRWNIHPVSIPKVTLRTAKSQLDFEFPTAAGGLSHLKLDPALAKYAVNSGAKLKTNTQVNSLKPKMNRSKKHLIELSNGECIETEHLLIATGRIPSYSTLPQKQVYVGFKTHFKNIHSQGNLEMFSLPGAYLGIAPIEDQKYNVACLAKLNIMQGISSQQFIENLIQQNPFVKNAFSQAGNLFNQWMVTSIPEFGVKKTPNWLDTYFIGDAAMTIPPACGGGLSMAILGGILAADYAFKSEFSEFKTNWECFCSSQQFWGKLLHKIMLNPKVGTPIGKLIQPFSFLTKKLYSLTRTTIM